MNETVPVVAVYQMLASVKANAGAGEQYISPRGDGRGRERESGRPATGAGDGRWRAGEGDERGR